MIGHSILVLGQRNHQHDNVDPNNDARSLVLLSVASRFGRDTPSLFRVHLCTLLFVFTHPPHPFHLCEYWGIRKSMLPNICSWVLFTSAYAFVFWLSQGKENKYLILIVTDDYAAWSGSTLPPIAAFVRTPWLGQDLRAYVRKVLRAFAHHAPFCFALHPHKSCPKFTFHLTRKLRAPSKFNVKAMSIPDS